MRRQRWSQLWKRTEGARAPSRVAPSPPAVVISEAEETPLDAGLSPDSMHASDAHSTEASASPCDPQESIAHHSPASPARDSPTTLHQDADEAFVTPTPPRQPTPVPTQAAAYATHELKSTFAQRLRTLAYFRHAIRGNGRFLYMAQLRPSDFATAVSPCVLKEWCMYLEKVRSVLALALQDVSLDAVERRVGDLERNAPIDWYLAEDEEEVPVTSNTSSPIVECLAALLAVLCALYAKLLASIDARFAQRIISSTAHTQVETVFGTVPMRTLLEPFPNKGTMTDLETLRMLHAALSVRSILTQDLVHRLAKNITFVSRYAAKTELGEWDALLAAADLDWDTLTAAFQDRQDRPDLSVGTELRSDAPNGSHEAASSQGTRRNVIPPLRARSVRARSALIPSLLWKRMSRLDMNNS